MTWRTLRVGLAAVAALALLLSCTDARQINAAFAQGRVTWFTFDPQAADGLRPLPGPEQPHRVLWSPRSRAVLATDLIPSFQAQGAVAVSRLGLILLEDRAGDLKALRPGAGLRLGAYSTGRLFLWKGKLFLSLLQETPVTEPAATLAWWEPGQARLAFYPVPSQVQDSAWQQAGLMAPSGTDSELGLVWTKRENGTLARRESILRLDTGEETPGTVRLDAVAPEPGPETSPLRSRLADRLGAEAAAAARQVRGEGPLVLFTEDGWVSVGRKGEAATRLYQLPPLGVAGRYTAGLALAQGFVYTWETAYRGYVGAAGLLHVPFALLAP